VISRDSSVGVGQWDKGSSGMVVFFSKEEKVILYSNRQRRYRRHCVKKERREKERETRANPPNIPKEIPVMINPK
jgi:hypothetical protein